MSEQEKPLTEAEKQIQRLEALRLKMQESAKASPEKIVFPPKTAVERTLESLRSFKSRAETAPASNPHHRIEGKQKSAKLTHQQLRALEALSSKDIRLNGSRIIRIALNQMLGLEQTAEEAELATRIQEILKKLKSES